MKVTYIRHARSKLFILAVLILIAVVMGLLHISDSVAQNAAALSSAKLPIYCTDNENREIALTINCAWGADDIEEILDTLDYYKIKASFFVLGTWAEKNPKELKMIYDRGHEIGNHSYSHKLPSKSSKTQLAEEIDKCNDAVEKVIGVKPQLYRAPSGDITETVLDLARERGMHNIKWSVDSIDWKDTMTYDNILNRVIGRTESGSILLFHNDTKHTAKVLPEVIETLLKQDYKFVKVSELIYTDDFYIDNNGVQRKK